MFIGIVLVAYLNHYENQKVKYGGHMIIEESVVLKTIDKIFGDRDHRSEMVTFVQGDVWVAQIGSFKITDPLALIGNISRTKKIYGILLISALMPIIATIVFGKVFCSWICPMGLLFEWNDRLRQFLIRHKVPLLQWKWPHGIKYGILGFGLLSGLIFGVHYFLIIYPPKLVSGEIYFWVTRGSFSYGLLFVFILLAGELLFAPRLWCRSLCPGGAVYTLLSKFRIVRIKNDLKKCINCGICDQVCPYELVPSKSHIGPDCDHCSLCVDQCPVDTLSFIVGKDQEVIPSKKETTILKKETIGQVIFVIMLSLACLWTVPASAHHIRGLPHYGYSENYPQIPTYEEKRIVDDWEISFSYIRIFETKNCDLAVYFKNSKTGEPYKGTVRFKVFRNGENPDDTHYFDTLLDPTNTFRVGWVYEEDGIYTTRVMFMADEKTYVEDFKMQVGDVGFNFLWLMVPGMVIVILVVMIITGRAKERKTV